MVRFVAIVLLFFSVYLCKCVAVCVCLGVIYGLLLSVESRRPGETLSYNGLRQIGLVSLKSGFFVGKFPVDFKQ